MGDVYGNIEEYNPNKQHKILMVIEDIITDMPSNIKLQQNYIPQSYFAVPTNIRLNSTHYFILKTN